MEAKIIRINEDIILWCDVCHRASFKGIQSSVSKAHLLFNLTKEEKEIARARLPFFNGIILICQKCVGFTAHKSYVWEAVLKMAELPDLDPKREYDFEINELSYP